jgi:hypothetical protein
VGCFVAFVPILNTGRNFSHHFGRGGKSKAAGRRHKNQTAAPAAQPLPLSFVLLYTVVPVLYPAQQAKKKAP